MNEQSFRLYLVRHAEIASSVAHRHTGLTVVALNANGEQQARESGKYLDSPEFTRVFTSPLQRATKTCELAGFAGSAETDHDLLEWGYGDYEGQTTPELRQRHPGWNIFTHICPNGETLNDVRRRADRFIRKVCSVPGNVIAFSSAHIIRVITARWLSMEPDAGRYFMASTAAINILDYEHDRNQPVICLWNE
ncbi:MAG: histidine phosphatase family protein [Gammaproteobacteria bacterium]